MPLRQEMAPTTRFARAWEAMAPERWAAARDQARAILRPLDDNHFAQLDGRSSHLRRCVPALIAALRFEGVPAARPLVDAIELLRELDATGRRGLPDTVATGFVSARWRAHVTGEDGRPDRRRWELCLLSELRPRGARPAARSDPERRVRRPGTPDDRGAYSGDVEIASLATADYRRGPPAHRPRRTFRTSLGSDRGPASEW